MSMKFYVKTLFTAFKTGEVALFCCSGHLYEMPYKKEVTGMKKKVRRIESKSSRTAGFICMYRAEKGDRHRDATFPG